MDRPDLSTGWLVALGATASLAVLAALPPVVGGEAGHVLRHAFSAVCHQIPERSPHLAGGPIALCHRCSGILLGLIAGLALAPAFGRAAVAAIARGGQGRWLAAAVVPTAVDWALGALGLWANTPLSRTATGALFGFAAGAILAANLLAPRRGVPAGSALTRRDGPWDLEHGLGSGPADRPTRYAPRPLDSSEPA